MKQFPEIIRILDRFRERRIETLDNGFKSRIDHKAFVLYDGIRTGLFPNDQVAAKSLYDTTPLDTRYTSLKSRLKSRLINSLYHLDLRQAGFSEYAQAVYSCNRRTFLVQTLIGMGARSTGINMARRTLDYAERFQLTVPALMMATVLREHSALTARAADYEYYDRLVALKSETLNAQLLATGFSERAQVLLSTKTGGTGVYEETIHRYLNDLAAIPEHARSFTFQIEYFRLQLLSHSAAGRHTEKIKVCDEALEYLDKNPLLSSNLRKAEFKRQKLESYIVRRDYENGIRTAHECEALIPIGTNNWFSFAMWYFLLLMHTSHFVEAESLYRQVTEHPRFEALPVFWRERWKLFELYLLYALQTVPEFESLPIRKRFDLQAFLRFMPTAAKDKHGLYIAVLIIHILTMLETKDFSGIIDRMDALRTYRTRYLRAGGNRRSAIFFKLLTVMENNSFSYKLVKAKSDRYYKQMLAAEIEDADTDEELQVIPYEWLWQRILAKLQSYEREYAGRI